MRARDREARRSETKRKRPHRTTTTTSDGDSRDDDSDAPRTTQPTITHTCTDASSMPQTNSTPSTPLRQILAIRITFSPNTSSGVCSRYHHLSLTVCVASLPHATLACLCGVVSWMRRGAAAAAAGLAEACTFASAFSGRNWRRSNADRPTKRGQAGRQAHTRTAVHRLQRWRISRHPSAVSAVVR